MMVLIMALASRMHMGSVELCSIGQNVGCSHTHDTQLGMRALMQFLPTDRHSCILIKAFCARTAPAAIAEIRQSCVLM